MQSRYYFTIVKLVIITAIPVILLILPGDFFDHNAGSICVSKIFFNTECFACGLTRAGMHFIHFEFEEAFAYHMWSLIAVPVLISFWVWWGLKEWKTFRKICTILRQPDQDEM